MIFSDIQPGILNRKEKKVTPSDTAPAYGSGLVEVYATPSMIALMEDTAQSAVQPHLPEGYITVGMEVHVKHLRATPVGRMVFCEARLIEVEGRKLTFEVKAWDEKDKIGEGAHIRVIVGLNKFLEKAGG